MPAVRSGAPWHWPLETTRWSAERAAAGELPVEIGLGLHYGEAIVGSIGDGQRLDYLVIGDTVNVASRLERLTREMNAQIVVSDELVARVRDEGAGADGLLDGFARRGKNTWQGGSGRSRCGPRRVSSSPERDDLTGRNAAPSRREVHRRTRPRAPLSLTGGQLGERWWIKVSCQAG